MAFADVDDYRAVYDSRTDDFRLQKLLDKASRRIRRACEAAGVSCDDPDADFEADLADVCIDMVHRVDGDPDTGDVEVPYGATQFSIGADGFSQSFSMGNPYGDLFLTKAEREMLGIADDGAIGSAWPMMQEDRGFPHA